jgi:hypothetical protein
MNSSLFIDYLDENNIYTKIIEKYKKNNIHQKYAFEIVDKLKNGETEIAIHSNILNFKNKFNYISGNDMETNSNTYKYMRKICYDIGNMLEGCKTQRITNRCGYYIGSNDSKWFNDGRCIYNENINDYDKKFPSDFSDYFVETINSENFSLYPKLYAVGVRFVFDFQQKQKNIDDNYLNNNNKYSEYLKTLGPFTRQK